MMMFKAALFTAVVTLLGSAFALPYQQEVELAVRDISVVGVRSIPVQVPKMIVRDEHVERAVVEERQIPEEDPVKSEGNGIVNYGKRADIAAEIAVKSDGGDIVPYPKRSIPVEIAVKSNGGEPVAYPKRDVIPSEKAVRSLNGVITLY